ncbi:ankyrin repeat domain-containing protein [Exiguobacterium indicum]|uniref:ankyrin repeat domain-containing protein n=1 Tax=Exiguobacterium indicum TaxID=296995 RepID=UPI002B26018B|nr:ankyrin repeat domain-containing protein [Exiguobacterium indicum]
MEQEMHERIDPAHRIRQAVTRKETVYFSLLLGIAILTVGGIIGLVFETGESGIYAMFALVILLLLLWLRQWQRVSRIRSEGVRLSAEQFPELFEQVRIHTEQLQLWRMPEIYFQDDVKRPHVIGLFQKYLIVLPTSYLELTETRRFRLLLELARIKRNHQEKQILLWIGSWIPFLRPAYMRACTRTRHQMVLPLISTAYARQAMFEDVLGPTLLATTDTEVYIEEKRQRRTFSILLYEALRTELSLLERLHLTGEPIERPRPLFRYGQGFVVAGSILMAIFLVSTTAGMLLDEGAIEAKKETSDENVTTKTNGQDLNETELMAAIQKGKLEDIHRLIPESDMKAVDADGDTALHYLGYRKSSTGLESVFKELLAAGSDVDAVNEFGERPFITAVFSNNDELVDLYLKRGEKVNQQDADKFTPLHHAVEGEGKETVKLLLEHGADPTIKNADGFTPLMLAQEYELDEIIELLKQNSAQTL